MPIAIAFDSPVGTLAERRGTELPPGDWYSSNGYANYYQLKPGVMAYHTGCDLLFWPGGGAHEPIYAIANGVVTFAQRIANSTWGNLIVIRHDMNDGSAVYSRYGHVENMLVVPGSRVMRGQQIASEGNAFGQFAYHLHFDISTTDRLAKYPADWPGTDLDRVWIDYVDPLVFIKGHHMTTTLDILNGIKAELTQIGVLVDQAIGTVQTAPPPPARATLTKYVTASPSMNVRSTQSTAISTNIVGKIAYQTAVIVYADQTDAAWYQIAASNAQYPEKYLAAQWLSDTRP